VSTRNLPEVSHKTIVLTIALPEYYADDLTSEHFDEFWGGDQTEGIYEAMGLLSDTARFVVLHGDEGGNELHSLHAIILECRVESDIHDVAEDERLTSFLEDVEPAHVATLTARITELEADADKSVCVFCGETTAKDLTAMLAHAEACEKRPENRLMKRNNELEEEVERLKVCGSCHYCNYGSGAGMRCYVQTPYGRTVLASACIFKPSKWTPRSPHPSRSEDGGA
jgi:hypothetical protein